ncbi:MAG: sialate O-acetylesterase [Rubripirellula sp.]
MNLLARFLLLSLAVTFFQLELIAAGPTKVFILAGQSNMEGHAKVETFDYLADDPDTAPLLKKMRGDDGQPRVCDGVWISYLTGSRESNGEGVGKLTAGFGSRRNPTEDGGKIGPEFTFGITVDELFDEPVLIIKTAWGGKSLYYDFRSPSSLPYQRTAQDIERDRNPPEKAGHYYRLMINHVRHVLQDIPRICPQHDPEQGFEIFGFVWFQGWNDMVNRDIYPVAGNDSQNRFAKYSRWMTEFIGDVRQDLDAPDMPFVIGVMGVGGDQPNEGNAEFRKAMAAPATSGELEHVVAVQTAPFWDEQLGKIDGKHGEVRQMGHLLRTKNKNHANKDGSMTDQQQREYLDQFRQELISPEEAALRKRGASNAGYHYLGCAKTFALIGQAFAEALSTSSGDRD